MPLISREYRKRLLKTATMEFDGTAIECIVRNLSESGAALQVNSSLGIPHEFKLTIHSEKLHRSCHVIWRQGKKIGIGFEA